MRTFSNGSSGVEVQENEYHSSGEIMKNRKSVILREARTMTNPFSKRGSGRRGSLEGLRDSGPEKVYNLGNALNAVSITCYLLLQNLLNKLDEGTRFRRRRRRSEVSEAVKVEGGRSWCRWRRRQSNRKILYWKSSIIRPNSQDNKSTPKIELFNVAVTASKEDLPERKVPEAGGKFTAFLQRSVSVTEETLKKRSKRTSDDRKQQMSGSRSSSRSETTDVGAASIGAASIVGSSSPQAVVFLGIGYFDGLIRHYPIQLISKNTKSNRVVQTSEQYKRTSKLIRFDFKIFYKPGKENKVVDALNRIEDARLPDLSSTRDHFIASLPLCLDLYTKSYALSSLPEIHDIR
ncbi:hypothetical protein LXL04_009517 [Taraxacum kok-saghyz]